MSARRGAPRAEPRHTPDRRDPPPGEGAGARDHLANWRTFLAEVRTALGAAALGFAVSELASGRPGAARLVGALLLVAGVGVLVGGTVRYERTRRRIEAGVVAAPRVAPVVLTVFALAGLVTALVVLW